MSATIQRRSFNLRFSMGNPSVIDRWMLCLDELVSTPILRLWVVVDPDSRVVHVEHGTGETTEEQLRQVYRSFCNRFVLPRLLWTDNGSRRKGGDADAR